MEAIAGIGLAASLITVVDACSKLSTRFKEFRSNSQRLPAAFRHIETELPLLNKTFRQLQDAAQNSRISGDTEQEVLPILDECIEQIETLDSLLGDVLPEANHNGWKKGKKVITSLQLESKAEKIRKVLGDRIRILTLHCAFTALNSKDESFTEICEWLNASDPTVHYQNAIDLRTPGTGLWFLNGKSFADWKSASPSYLWLHGIPGSGKTVLSASIIQDLSLCCKDNSEKALAYYFFKFDNAQEHDPIMMLKSFIQQLLRHCVTIPPTVKGLFSKIKCGGRAPLSQEVLELFRLTLGLFPCVYLVVDALDECDQQANLLKILEKVATWQLHNIHLIVTSRQERFIELSLEAYMSRESFINLPSDIIDEDIKIYMQERFNGDIQLKKWHSNSTIGDEINVALADGAQGMFRWAVCQLDALARCRNKAMLQKYLKSLPPDLFATYDRILLSISEEDATYAKRILQWLAFSSRPLLLSEVAEVAAIDMENGSILNVDEVLEDPAEALDICSSLVTVEPVGWRVFRGTVPGLKSYNMAVKLSHQSVKAYLLSDQSKKEGSSQYKMSRVDGNGLLAESCLQYLMQVKAQDLLNDKKLLYYAAHEWYIHAQKADEQEKGWVISATRFISTCSWGSRGWMEIHNLQTRSDDPLPGKSEGTDADIFVFCCLLSLDALAETEIRTDYRPINSRQLEIAAYCNLTPLAKSLLDSDYDVNLFHKDLHEAVRRAARQGNKQVLELLLEKCEQIHLSNQNNIVEERTKPCFDFGSCLGDALLEALWSSNKGDVVALLQKKASSVELKFDRLKFLELRCSSNFKNIMKKRIYSGESNISALKENLPAIDKIVTDEAILGMESRLWNLASKGYSAPTSFMEKYLDEQILEANKQMTGNDTTDVMEAYWSLDRKLDTLLLEDNYIPHDLTRNLDLLISGGTEE